MKKQIDATSTDIGTASRAAHMRAVELRVAAEEAARLAEAAEADYAASFEATLNDMEQSVTEMRGRVDSIMDSIRSLGLEPEGRSLYLSCIREDLLGLEKASLAIRKILP